MLREIIAVVALAACLTGCHRDSSNSEKSDSISPETSLSYGISSDPDPIQVSPENANPSFTTLTFVMSNNTEKAIFCNQISFTIAVGEGAQSLAADAKGIVALATPSDAWQIEGDGQGNFKATPTKPKYQKIADDGLVFQLKGIHVNKQPGITTLVVTESCSMDNKTFSSKEGHFDLTKFPYGFYVKDFAPSQPRVKNGETVTLTWSGSDLATYTILYDDRSVDVSNKRTWTSPKLNHVTTFILKSSAQVSGETINSYRSTTVTVADPELNATTLNASGTVKAKQFEGDGAALTVEGATLARIKKTLAEMVPIGTIMTYGGDVGNPAIVAQLKSQGWLVCDGGLVGREAYKELFQAINVSFGAGDGKTTFHLPDMRGRFVRGVSYGATDLVEGKQVPRDPDTDIRTRTPSALGGNDGDKVGSVQGDAYKEHSHPLEHEIQRHGRSFTGSSKDTDKPLKDSKGDPYISTTKPEGGKETRPKNIYVNWIIKAKNVY